MKQDSFTSGIPTEAIVSAKVIDRADLIAVRLIQFSGTVKPFPVTGKPFDLGLECNTRAEIDKNLNRIAILAKLKVSINQHQDRKPSTDPSQPISATSPDAEIMVEHAIIYQIKSFEGLTEQDYGIFANTAGVFHAWSYWREFVQNMSVRMGLPPVVLPLFRMVPVPPVTLNPPKKSKAKSKHPS